MNPPKKIDEGQTSQDGVKSSNIDPSEKKPPKPEDKPFQNFINEEFIPCLRKALSDHGKLPITLSLTQENRPVVGGQCWIVKGEIHPARRFWLCFSEEAINSKKTIILAETGTEPSLLESFLIDEKRTTLALLLSRTLQRLNGQKWLSPN